MLSGSLRVKWGDRLESELTLEPGDLVYVPPRETHVLENVSESEPAEYVVARDSPHEDAVVVPWAEEHPVTARRESSLAGVGGLEIYWQAWLPDSGASAVVVIAHGAGEHSGRYPHVAARLVGRGLCGVRDRPPRSRPVSGPARLDRPARQRGRRSRQARRARGRPASRQAGVPAGTQHGSNDLAVLRDAPPGSPLGSDPDRAAGGDRGRARAE